MFLVLSVTASRLSETAHASLVPLHKCLGLRTSHYQMEQHQEGRLLASQIRAPHVVLTGWNFFAFSRGFVLTLAGALLSYVVIILQMNPGSGNQGDAAGLRHLSSRTTVNA